MKTTVMGIILELAPEQKDYLDTLMSRYCAAVRWSFKRLLEGKEVQVIRKNVQEKFSLNSRQANDAVYDAQSTIKSQTELVKYHHANALAKVDYTKKQLEKAKSPRRIADLTKKQDKQLRRLARWEKYLKENTFPSVIFGGKDLFLRRCKGLITKEEWLDARSNRYLSRGDKAKGGNLNTRIYAVGGNIYLDIVAEAVKTEKSVRYNRISAPIYLAYKPSKKTGKVNGTNYRQMVLDYLKTGNAYQVEIIRKKSKYYVHVSFEEETPIPYVSKGGALGIDTNPDGLGLSRLDYLGQFKGSLWLTLAECTYARSNRRTNLIGETVAYVVDMAKKNNLLISVEDLEFKNDKSVSVKFNRMCHGFIWSKFLSMLDRKALREGVPIKKVKPAFTSIIGILKYQALYGLSNHAAASYVIGRRGLGYEYENVPTPLIKRFVKEEKRKGFKELSNWKQWSSIKNAVVAAIRKYTRKKVKSLVSWQHYRKQLLVTG